MQVHQLLHKLLLAQTQYVPAAGQVCSQSCLSTLPVQSD
jgi:hypothetical protein